MKITKFVHSCVLVEANAEAVLFDPGVYSWNSGLVNLDSFPSLTAIIVTHAHGDHCAEPFVKALVQKFPNARWFAPSDLASTLNEWGVREVSSNSMDNFQVAEVSHADVKPYAPQVRNLIANWDGLVTHPGDTHDFSATNPVLLLPIDAPWGTTIRAINLALELKPKYIVPIHDGMWNDGWKQGSYQNLEKLFADNGITFVKPEDGVSFEVSVE